MMTGIFVPQQHNPASGFFSPGHLPQQSCFSDPAASSSSKLTMDSQHPYHPNQSSSMETQSSPIAGPSTFRNSNQAPIPTTPSSTQYLPRQVFSSPNEPQYPASTMAAVEATRARFFARQTNTTLRPSSKTRATPFGSTTLPPTKRLAPKTHALSSASSASYRQSFFERCQRAMTNSRASQRSSRISAFRKGADGATPGLFSDEMEEDDPPSSPPSFFGDQGEAEGREEDDEMTRRRIIAEYSRLKKIYELKGHLEIGWIDPDQLSWLEQQEEAEGVEEVDDPWWNANDEELEALWLESQEPSQGLNGGDVDMGEERMEEEDWGDEEFEQALARLPV